MIPTTATPFSHRESESKLLVHRVTQAKGSQSPFRPGGDAGQTLTAHGLNDWGHTAHLERHLRALRTAVSYQRAALNRAAPLHSPQRVRTVPPINCRPRRSVIAPERLQDDHTSWLSRCLRHVDVQTLNERHRFTSLDAVLTGAQCDSQACIHGLDVGVCLLV